MKNRLMTGVLLTGLSVLVVPGVVSADEHIDVLENVPTVVSVVQPSTTPDFPVASLSRADCEVVVHMEAEDGSAQEFMSCQLNDEPLMVPENQGSAPESVVVDAGGECIWTSDYWYTKDESEIKALAFEAIVTPSGRVFAWSSYPAEPLACPDEG